MSDSNSRFFVYSFAVFGVGVVGLVVGAVVGMIASSCDDAGCLGRWMDDIFTGARIGALVGFGLAIVGLAYLTSRKRSLSIESAEDVADDNADE